MKGRRSPRGLIFALVVAFFSPSAYATTEGPEDPPFEVLLEAQPVVVVAKIHSKVGTSRKSFKAADKEPALTEEYDHYRFNVVALLKGKLPDPFEIRVIAGRSKLSTLSSEDGKEVLLVLAPDYGLDPQGNRRMTYLITHRAVYPVANGTVEVVTAAGTQTWTIQRVKDTITAFEDARAKRRASSPEPPEAATVAVVSGEDTPPSEPERAPPAKTFDGRVPSPPEIVAKAQPIVVKGPAGEPARRFTPLELGMLVVVVALLALVLVVVVMRYRRRSG
jgi:hypothetical protein